MNSYGLDTAQAREVWQPFLDWIELEPDAYSIDGFVTIGSVPAQHWWDAQWWNAHWPEIGIPNPEGSRLVAALHYVLQLLPQPTFDVDERPGAGPNDAWWKGDAGQVAWFIHGYESLWLPASLLESNAQERLADALFGSSRHAGFGLHFNKGLAGAPADAVTAAADTATNPAVLTAFALVIGADAEGWDAPVHPSIPGHEPSVASGRQAAARVHRCMDELRALVPDPGAYVSESNFFEEGWQRAYWGSNYPRLSAIKQKYDPDGLFVVHNGVGSEQWSGDGFSKL
jgi:FAD/FMN-containing dehydrogenase